MIITLGCGQKNVHRFRTDTLYNYISTENPTTPTDVICSGGVTAGKIIPESTTMATRLKSRGILENFPNIMLHEESLSTDTAKNIRNSLIFILEKNLQIPDSIRIFTSHFHIERTRQFANHILQSEFSDLDGLRFEMISAEDFASESQKRHLLKHPSWQDLHANFAFNEEKWLLLPVEHRERNKPNVRPTFL